MYGSIVLRSGSSLRYLNRRWSGMHHASTECEDTIPLNEFIPHGYGSDFSFQSRNARWVAIVDLAEFRILFVAHCSSSCCSTHLYLFSRPVFHHAFSVFARTKEAASIIPPKEYLTVQMGLFHALVEHPIWLTVMVSGPPPPSHPPTP